MCKAKFQPGNSIHNIRQVSNISFMFFNLEVPLLTRKTIWALLPRICSAHFVFYIQTKYCMKISNMLETELYVNIYLFVTKLADFGQFCQP